MKLGLSFCLRLSAALVSVQLCGVALADQFYASPAQQSVNSADVGIDARGNTSFTWTTFTSQGVVVQLRRRSASGNLAATQTLSKAGHDAQPPHVAVNGDGDAVVVWQVYHGDASTTTPVQGRARAADGTLSPIFNVDPHPGGAFSYEFANPKVGIDDAGNAVFTWIGLDGDQKKRAYARRRTAAGSVGPVKVLSPTGVSESRMAINGAGTAVFVWVWNNGAGQNQIQARRLFADGTLGPMKIIGEGIAPGGGGGLGTVNPQAALDPDGNALIVWEQPDGQGPCGINGCPKILARTFSSSNVVGTTPQTMTTTVEGGRSPNVVMNKQGRAIVSWVHGGLEFRTRSSAGMLGAVQNFTTASDITEPALKGDAAGSTLAVWHSGTAIQSRVRSADGTLGLAGTHSIDGQSAFGGVGAAAGRGKAVVAWTQSDNLGQCSGGSSCTRVGGAVPP